VGIAVRTRKSVLWKELINLCFDDITSKKGKSGSIFRYLLAWKKRKAIRIDKAVDVCTWQRAVALPLAKFSKSSKIRVAYRKNLKKWIVCRECWLWRSATRTGAQMTRRFLISTGRHQVKLSALKKRILRATEMTSKVKGRRACLILPPTSGCKDVNVCTVHVPSRVVTEDGTRFYKNLPGREYSSPKRSYGDSS